jgi:hypothetical protein
VSLYSTLCVKWLASVNSDEPLIRHERTFKPYGTATCRSASDLCCNMERNPAHAKDAWTGALRCIHACFPPDPVDQRCPLSR